MPLKRIYLKDLEKELDSAVIVESQKISSDVVAWKVPDGKNFVCIER